MNIPIDNTVSHSNVWDSISFATFHRQTTLNMPSTMFNVLFSHRMTSIQSFEFQNSTNAVEMLVYSCACCSSNVIKDNSNKLRIDNSSVVTLTEKEISFARAIQPIIDLEKKST